MELNYDCWHLIVEVLRVSNLKFLYPLRQTCSRLRLICDPVLFDELDLDLDKPDEVSHYLCRLQDSNDILRHNVRNIRVLGQENQLDMILFAKALVQTLSMMELRGMALNRLKTFKWHTTNHMPTIILDTLEKCFPNTRLYIDGRSLGIPEPQHGHTPIISESDYNDLLKAMSRLLSSPLLYSFSSFAMARARDSEETHADPRTLEFIKRHMKKTSALRELDITMVRVQDQPYFDFREEDEFPPLESLRLNFSLILHGPSHLDTLNLWVDHMDWTQLRTLKLDAVSQTQCEAICTALKSKIPSLTELSMVICGSIGPVDNALIRAWGDFLDHSEKLEDLTLVADFPNYYHWPTVLNRPSLRRLTHRLPASFLVSRYPLLSCTHLAQIATAPLQNLEYLSIDVDLSYQHQWQWEILDAVAQHRNLTHLDIRTHLTAKEWSILEPDESRLMLEQAFQYINNHKAGRKLRRLDGTFRITADHLRVTVPGRRLWELQIACTLSERDDEKDTINTKISQDAEYQFQLRDALDEHRRSLQMERSSKRRRSGRFSRSSRCSFESTRPLIEALRSSTWTEDLDE